MFPSLSCHGSGSGKIYYTTDTDERNGGVKFKDDRTNSTVILHSAEVSEISEEEYEAEVKGIDHDTYQTGV